MNKFKASTCRGFFYLLRLKKDKLRNTRRCVLLKTKSFLAPIDEENDGIRISVMSRHKWPVGIIKYTYVTEITSNMYDFWFRELAPSEELVGKFLRKQISWNDFSGIYLDELKKPENIKRVRILVDFSLVYNITLLCLEKTPEKCHRRLLALKCKNFQPKLEISIF